MFGQDGVPDGTKEGADFPHGAWLAWGQGSLSSLANPELQRTQPRPVYSSSSSGLWHATNGTCDSACVLWKVIQLLCASVSSPPKCRTNLSVLRRGFLQARGPGSPGAAGRSAIPAGPRAGSAGSASRRPSGQGRPLRSWHARRPAPHILEVSLQLRPAPDVRGTTS